MPGTMLAFDDTDSPEGMCTTYLAALMIDEFSDMDMIGLPRLVRLNPNIPWKTRGNAAVCLSFGKGAGSPKPCGYVAGREVVQYPRGEPADPEEVLSRASKVLEKVARFECDKTNPGIVVSNRKPPPGLYWSAVRSIVALKDAEKMLRRTGAVWRKFKNGRGVVGAGAAMSWRPRDRTWEVIAYRRPSAFGSERRLDPDSVMAMDKATKWTFNNYDYENGHIAIAPGSPCPILFGIRGDSPDELLRAKDMIKGEKPEQWLLFLTNQGTEDHIVARRVRSLKPRDSARIEVKVVSPPRTIQGKHVILRVSDGDEIDAAFYEPSRAFRDVARALVPGDSLTIYGSVRETPRSLNVEKIRVKKLVREIRKAHNPKCPQCGKRMGSLGTGQGFRCKRCGSKAPPSAAEFEELLRSIAPGWYEPPVASRRHLHKPIRRMPRLT